LVVVANIKMRTLKVEVEKGFVRTAFDHELVGPKTKINLENLVIGAVLFFLFFADLVIRVFNWKGLLFIIRLLLYMSKGNWD